MKRLMLVLAMAIFLMLGCSSGGDDVVTQPQPEAVGTAPAITDYQLWLAERECVEYFDWDIYDTVSSCLLYEIEKTDIQLELDDIVVLWLGVYDPDLDIVTFTVKEYLRINGEYQLHHGPDTYSLVTQETESGWYVLLSEITGPPGEWKSNFWVTDAEGSDSNVLSIFTTVAGTSGSGSALASTVGTSGNFGADLGSLWHQRP